MNSTSVQGGTVTFSGGRLVYRPPTNYLGPDSFEFRVIDNGSSDQEVGGIVSSVNDFLQAVGTIVVNVLDQNDPPVANPDQLQINEDPGAPVVFAESTFIGNDSFGAVGTKVEITGFQRLPEPPSARFPSMRRLGPSRISHRRTLSAPTPLPTPFATTERPMVPLIRSRPPAR